MFRARFRKYWCDRYSEYTDITANSVKEILEFVYKVHKDSVYPAYSKFCCCGKWEYGNAFLEANASLPEKCGFRGSLWLERITYGSPNGEVIIFSKNDGYISPKASEAFNSFREIAKQRDKNKNFGDY